MLIISTHCRKRIRSTTVFTMHLHATEDFLGRFKCFSVTSWQTGRCLAGYLPSQPYTLNLQRKRKTGLGFWTWKYVLHSRWNLKRLLELESLSLSCQKCTNMAFRQHLMLLGCFTTLTLHFTGPFSLPVEMRRKLKPLDGSHCSGNPGF